MRDPRVMPDDHRMTRAFLVAMLSVSGCAAIWNREAENRRIHEAGMVQARAAAESAQQRRSACFATLRDPDATPEAKGACDELFAREAAQREAAAEDEARRRAAAVGMIRVMQANSQAQADLARDQAAARRTTVVRCERETDSSVVCRETAY